MDQRHFDRIARSFTVVWSRRGITRALGGLALAEALGLRLGLAATEARKKKHKRRKNNKRPPSCTDRSRNGDETDVDCGGSCPPCANGQRCLIREDCISAVCNGGTCQTCPYGTLCGSDADGNCYCEHPAAGGPDVCFKSEEETTVGSCAECAADTTCAKNSQPGSFDCRKVCGSL